jgi:hypothetical protein
VNGKRADRRLGPFSVASRSRLAASSLLLGTGLDKQAPVGRRSKRSDGCLVLWASRGRLGATVVVDFFTNFWGPKLICHTFVSFDFGPDGYVCISIETRTTKGQAYSAIAGLYRQYELYYVIGDERDIVRLSVEISGLFKHPLRNCSPSRHRLAFSVDSPFQPV